MTEAKVIWKSRKFRKELHNLIAAKLAKVGANVEKQVVKRISEGQPTKLTKPKSGNAVRVGLEPSKEGESPKVVTGQLRQSIFHKIYRRKNKIGVSIGSTDNPKKVLALELRPEDNGVYKGMNRPFFRPSLYSLETRRIVKKTFRGGKQVNRKGRKG